MRSIFIFLFFSINLFSQAPTISNFRIEDSNKNRVYFDSSEVITASSTTGFYLSDGLRQTVTGITINGTFLTGHYFTVNTPFDYWDTFTIRYEGGSNLQDLDGNTIYDFWLTDIYNNISEPANSGSTYYVRTTGSDANDGLTHATAFLTLGKAITETGNTIFIEAGTYNLQVHNITYNGTATNPVKIIGYKTQTDGVPDEIINNYWEWATAGTGMSVALDATEMPTFIGNTTIRDAENDTGTWLNVSNFLIIKNIQMKWYDRGLQITGNNHVVAKNMNFTFMGKPSNGQGAAIWALGGLDGEASINNKWNKFINVNSAQGMSLIRLYGGGSLFDKVRVYNDGADGVSDYMLNNYEGSNNTYRNCLVDRIGPGGGGGGRPASHGFGTKSWGYIQEYSLWQDCTAIYCYGGIEMRHDGSKNNVIRNFTYFDRPGDNDGDSNGSGKEHQTNGIVMRDNASKNKIENSTIHNSYRGLYFTDQSGEQGYQTPGFDNQFRNIVIYDVQYAIGTNAPSNQPWVYGNTFDNLTIDRVYKMYWTSGSSWLYDTNFLTNSSISNVKQNSGGTPTESNNNYYNIGNFTLPTGTNITTHDPQFVNANSGDFHLQSTSPIKDLGKDVINVNYDKNGIERKSGKYSIGAYQKTDNSTGSVIANAGANQDICQGESIILTASGGSSYVWNTGATTKSITVNPAVTTTYTVTVSDGNNSDSDSVQITVNSVTATAGSNVSINGGDSITLTASGGDTYVWNTGATTQSITVSPTATTSYTVTAKIGDCEDTDTVQVEVNTTTGSVIANAGANQDICQGDSVTLTASGGSTYSWSTGATTASITVSPNSTTTYIVTVTDGNNSDSDSVQVTVNSVIANAGSNVSINGGDSITLTASGGDTYVWNTGATTQSITVSPTATTSYTVTAKTGNCEDTDTVQVVVNTTTGSVNANAGADQDICQGDSVTLTASGGSTYSWSTGATTQSITVSPTATTSYTVTVSQEGSSSGTDSVTVTVSELPVANAGSDVTIEEGENIKLTALGGSTYSWSTGATTQSITVSPSATSNYTVTVYKNGCEATDVVKVTVESKVTNPPPADANAGEDVSICLGDSTILTASGGDTYVWSTGATTKSIEVNPTRTTTYTLSATRGGVTNSDTIVVTVENCSTLSEKTKQDEFIVYPNPTDGTIHVKASNNYDILNLNIYTIKGSIVYSGEIQTIDNTFYKTVDLSSLTKGVYIVRLYNSGYHKTKKILLQ